MSWIRFMYCVLVVVLYPFMVVMCMALAPVMGFLFARRGPQSDAGRSLMTDTRKFTKEGI